MHGLADIRIPLSSVISCRQHIGSDGKPHEKIYQKVNQRRCCTHSRQGIISRKTADHNNVRCIEQKLQNARPHQRERKEQHLLQNRAVGHVDLMLMLFFLPDFFVFYVFFLYYFHFPKSLFPPFQVFLCHLPNIPILPEAVCVRQTSQPATGRVPVRFPQHQIRLSEDS